MNYQTSLHGLPIPSDCVDIINSYLFLDKLMFKNKLIKMSILVFMRRSINIYNDAIYGYIHRCDTFIFRWFYTHIQHQILFCIKCGEYKAIENGIINQNCSCKCV